MSDLLREINISDIDLTDDRYEFSFSKKDITFLAQSIKEEGLLCPPIVRPMDHKFIIVSGFNRIRALIHNHQPRVIVYQTQPDATDYQCLLKSITAIAFQRALTHAEFILSARRLNQFLNKEQMAKKSSVIFNTQLNTAFVHDLLTIGGLPDPTLELIHTGNLSFRSAQRISLFEKNTQKIFLTVFSNIKASQNKQLEIILYLMEITKRDGITPEWFFKNQEIQDILFDTKKEPGLKTTLFRAYLFEQRFPTIVQKRQRIQEKISCLKFGNAIKFLPPENFDSQSYSISFTANNYNEFSAKVQTLKTALKNKALTEIFNP